MIDFELDDMTPRYCQLVHIKDGVKYTIDHLPPYKVWKWSIECETKSGKDKDIMCINGFDTAEMAFENMKRYINALQS